MKRSTAILTICLLIVAGIVVYMTHLSREVAREEAQRVAIWAEATERMIQAGDDEDIDFYTEILEQNTSIPVYMVDSAGNILLSRNVSHPVADPRSLSGPIEVRIPTDSEDIVQYIYYDESTLLVQLRYFPYVLAFLIITFVAIAIVLIMTQLKAEQNRVWVGLSKETAHQLGTPISSLNGWQELLEMKYPDDTMIPEMRKDISRLTTIADRFGKVGSRPELRDEDIDTVIANTAQYMQTRLGSKIQIEYPRLLSADPLLVKLSDSLFSWVIENLIKNAADAGATSIRLLLTEEGEQLQLDIIDNGHGISGRNPSRVFRPGYTTKRRGWGLGLSLAKRIVEEYHGGRLLIQSTAPGVGTTFRIYLNTSKR